MSDSVNPWIAARQASLSITNSRSPPKLMSIESVMPSHPLSSPSPPALNLSQHQDLFKWVRIRWPKYWSFSFNISLSNEHPGLIPLEWTGWISLWSKELKRVFSSTTVQKHQFFGAQPSLWTNLHICTWLLEKPISICVCNKEHNFFLV